MFSNCLDFDLLAFDGHWRLEIGRRRGKEEKGLKGWRFQGVRGGWVGRIQTMFKVVWLESCS